MDDQDATETNSEKQKQIIYWNDGQISYWNELHMTISVKTPISTLVKTEFRANELREEEESIFCDWKNSGFVYSGTAQARVHQRLV